MPKVLFFFDSSISLIILVIKTATWPTFPPLHKDFIEDNSTGTVYITETQKTIARIHKVSVKGRDRERERERGGGGGEREREAETDTETERERSTERKRERERERERERDRDRERV